MAREIRHNEEFKDKLLKLIPSEIVAAYMVLQGIISSPIILGNDPSGNPKNITVQVGFIVFFILLVLTPLYLKRFHNVTSKSQMLFTAGTFAVWAYSLKGPFEAMQLYHPAIASIILVLWTLLIPLAIKQKPAQLPAPQSSPPVPATNT